TRVTTGTPVARPAAAAPPTTPSARRCRSRRPRGSRNRSRTRTSTRPGPSIRGASPNPTTATRSRTSACSRSSCASPSGLRSRLRGSLRRTYELRRVERDGDGRLLAEVAVVQPFLGRLAPFLGDARVDLLGQLGALRVAVEVDRGLVALHLPAVDI